MQQRQPHYQDITPKKCSFIVISGLTDSLAEKLQQLPEEIQTAFVLYSETYEQDHICYIDQNKKPFIVKLNAKDMLEIKNKLELGDILFQDDAIQVYIDNMSATQLHTIISLTKFFPTWLHRAAFLTHTINDLQEKVWDKENEIRMLEGRIGRLELLCPKKYTEADLEKIYPKSYMTTQIRPTDYKLVKLPELDGRVERFFHSDNIKALSQQQREIQEIVIALKQLKTDYLLWVHQLELVRQELNNFAKEMPTEGQFQQDCRAEIKALPAANQIIAVSIIPHAVLLNVLVDIFRNLKNLYEKKLCEAFKSATNQDLTFNTFEDLLTQVFNKPARDHYTEFAKKPTSEMTNVVAAFNVLGQAFWQKNQIEIPDQEKCVEFNICFMTLSSLANVCETFSLINKMQCHDGKLPVKGRNDVPTEFSRELAVQLQNLFAMMPVLSRAATAIESTYNVWLEAVIWLYGLHQRAFSQLSPHCKNGDMVNSIALTHIGNDDERQFFQNIAPLTKWTTEQYNYSHCTNLLLLLPSNVVNELLPCFPSAMQEQHKKKYPPGQLVSVPHVVNADVPVKSLLPAAKLKGMEAASLKGKLSAMKIFLMEYTLTKEQETFISALMPPMLKVLDDYIGANFKSYWMPTYFSPQTFDIEAKTARGAMQKSQSPSESLIALITLRLAIGDTYSLTLGPAAEKTLQDIYIFLCIEEYQPAITNTNRRSSEG